MSQEYGRQVTAASDGASNVDEPAKLVEKSPSSDVPGPPEGLISCRRLVSWDDANKTRFFERQEDGNPVTLPGLWSHEEIEAAADDEKDELAPLSRHVSYTTLKRPSSTSREAPRSSQTKVTSESAASSNTQAAPDPYPTPPSTGSVTSARAGLTSSKTGVTSARAGLKNPSSMATNNTTNRTGIASHRTSSNRLASHTSGSSKGAGASPHRRHGGAADGKKGPFTPRAGLGFRRKRGTSSSLSMGQEQGHGRPSTDGRASSNRRSVTSPGLMETPNQQQGVDTPLKKSFVVTGYLQQSNSGEAEKHPVQRSISVTHLQNRISLQQGDSVCSNLSDGQNQSPVKHADSRLRLSRGRYGSSDGAGKSSQDSSPCCRDHTRPRKAPASPDSETASRLRSRPRMVNPTNASASGERRMKRDHNMSSKKSSDWVPLPALNLLARSSKAIISSAMSMVKKNSKKSTSDSQPQDTSSLAPKEPDGAMQELKAAMDSKFDPEEWYHKHAGTGSTFFANFDGWLKAIHGMMDDLNEAMAKLRAQMEEYRASLQTNSRPPGVEGEVERKEQILLAHEAVLLQQGTSLQQAAECLQQFSESLSIANNNGGPQAIKSRHATAVLLRLSSHADEPVPGTDHISPTTTTGLGTEEEVDAAGNNQHNTHDGDIVTKHSAGNDGDDTAAPAPAESNDATPFDAAGASSSSVNTFLRNQPRKRSVSPVAWPFEWTVFHKHFKEHVSGIATSSSVDDTWVSAMSADDDLRQQSRRRSWLHACATAARKAVEQLKNLQSLQEGVSSSCAAEGMMAATGLGPEDVVLGEAAGAAQQQESKEVPLNGENVVTDIVGLQPSNSSGGQGDDMPNRSNLKNLITAGIGGDTDAADAAAGNNPATEETSSQQTTSDNSTVAGNNAFRSLSLHQLAHGVAAVTSSTGGLTPMDLNPSSLVITSTQLLPSGSRGGGGGGAAAGMNLSRSQTTPAVTGQSHKIPLVAIDFRTMIPVAGQPVTSPVAKTGPLSVSGNGAGGVTGAGARTTATGGDGVVVGRGGGVVIEHFLQPTSGHNATDASTRLFRWHATAPSHSATRDSDRQTYSNTNERSIRGVPHGQADIRSQIKRLYSRYFHMRSLSPTQGAPPRSSPQKSRTDSNPTSSPDGSSLHGLLPYLHMDQSAGPYARPMATDRHDKRLADLALATLPSPPSKSSSVNGQMHPAPFLASSQVHPVSLHSPHHQTTQDSSTSSGLNRLINPEQQDVRWNPSSCIDDMETMGLSMSSRGVASKFSPSPLRCPVSSSPSSPLRSPPTSPTSMYVFYERQETPGSNLPGVQTNQNGSHSASPHKGCSSGCGDWLVPSNRHHQAIKHNTVGGQVQSPYCGERVECGGGTATVGRRVASHPGHMALSSWAHHDNADEHDELDLKMASKERGSKGELEREPLQPEVKRPSNSSLPALVTSQSKSEQELQQPHHPRKSSTELAKSIYGPSLQRISRKSQQRFKSMHGDSSASGSGSRGVGERKGSIIGVGEREGMNKVGGDQKV